MSNSVNKYRIKEIIDGNDISRYYPQVNYWVVDFGGTVREFWRELAPKGCSTKEEALSYCVVPKVHAKTVYHNVEI